MYYLLSDIGKVREKNEDFAIHAKISKDIEIYIVLDGIGGYNSGEVASRTAGKKVVEYLKKNITEEKIKKETIREAIIVANKEIYKMNIENKKYRGMGTTLSLLALQGNIGYIVNIGDSRIYRIKEGIDQITEDDTYINALLKDKIINKDEAANHPQKHMLLKALGINKNIEFEVEKIQRYKGDKFLLCTDGLTNMLKDSEILRLARANKGQRVPEKLIYMANKKGGTDNITVLYIENDIEKEES